jgi:DNA-binding phage protein
MKKTSNKWDDSLIESLKNLDHFAMYLESALEEQQPEKEFLLEILKDLMQASHESHNYSDDLESSYQEMVKILQETGGKEIYSFINLIQKLGLTIKIEVLSTHN